MVSLGSIPVDILTIFVHIRRVFVNIRRVFVHIFRIRDRLKVIEWFRIRFGLI